MSEVYLTKIERKTIFTKALIFVLIMVIISDLTVTGPFWFNFIPWLYILGTAGSLKKIDSVLMCIIGAFNVFIASTISWGGVYFTCIMDTVVALASLVLGIITGRILYEFVLEHRLVKYIRRSKKIIYIIMTVVMFFASYLMVGLNSGNIVTYLKSKANLKEYISKTYNVQAYDIIKTKYNKEVPGKYTYRINIDGQEIYFVPVTNDVFKDANKDTRYLQASRELDKEIANKPDNIVTKYTTLENAIIRFKLEYNDFAIAPDTVVLSVECTTTLQNNELDAMYDELANCIKELQTIKASQKIIITVNGETLQLTNNHLEQLSGEYIKGGFEIEEISE